MLNSDFSKFERRKKYINIKNIEHYFWLKKQKTLRERKLFYFYCIYIHITKKYNKNEMLLIFTS